MAAMLLLLLLAVVGAEESAGSVRHGVCEVDLERLQALEAELVAVIRDVDVRRVKEEHAQALLPLQPRDAQARWGDGRPESSELFAGSRTFRGRFNLPDERPVSLDDLRANDYMGSAVAINPPGTVALFGARGRDDVGLDAGGAMVFERSYCSDVYGFPYACWIEAYRMSPMVGTLANTGQAVALSHAGDVAAVGSRGAEVDSNAAAGMVMIYIDSNGPAFGGWSLEAELQSPTPAPQAYFGDAVAVHPDGSLVVIGSYGVNLPVEDMVTFDCDLDFFTQGTAECPGGCDYTPTHNETPTCQLAAPVVTDATGAAYGTASYVLQSSGELVRCPGGCQATDFTSFTPTCALVNGSTDLTDCAQGCLFLPERIHTPVCWSQLNRTANPGIASDVIFNQTSSCPLGCNYSAINASCTGTALNVTLNATCTGTADTIVSEATCTGTALEVLVDETCVGQATPVPLPAGTVMGAGQAFVATPGEDGWEMEELQRAQRPEQDSRFGSAVAVMGDSVFVGAPGPGTSHGNVYVFRRNAATGRWEERQVLIPSDSQPDQSFGSFLSVGSEASGIVAISADTFSTRTAQYAGRVYLFRRLPAHNASVFTVVQQKGCGWDGLDAEGQYQHQGPSIGGAGVSLEECERACGLAWQIGVECNYLSHSPVTGPADDLRGGICRMFRTCYGESLGTFTTTFRYTTYVEDEWVEFCPLVPDYSVAFDRFGTSVAISDDSTTIAVGASFGEVAGGVANTGEVFLYNSNQYGDFIQRKRMVPADSAGQTVDARFGVSVALDGDATMLAVGCELAENPVYTETECLNLGGAQACENTGAVYMYTAQCPLLPMLNSNRDGSAESGSGKRPCFATAGMDCTFSCNSGWKGGNGSSYPYRNLNGSINHEAIRVTPPTSSPAYRATNTSIGTACATESCAVQRSRRRYQPLMSTDNGEYRRQWDSILRQYVFVNSNEMKLTWRSDDGKWCIYNAQEELVAFSGGMESFRLQDGPPVGPLERGWMVMGWLADGEAEYVADYSFELSFVELVDQDSYPQYHIGCRFAGSFHADWEIDTDQLCYSVPCPPNAHYTDPTATACVCDDGYSPGTQPTGQLDPPRWIASDEAWAGFCVPEPCEPSYIAHSNRAEFATSGVHDQHRLPACVGKTFDKCFFTCDPAYRCSVPPTPAWLAADDGPSPSDDGSWDMTVPDLTRTIDPRERPVTCQGENTPIYCDRDGAFQRATCVYTPCQEFAHPVRHYCYDEDDDPILLEAFEDEDTGEPVPFDDRDSAMLAAAKEECLDDEDNRWVGDFGAEEGCECIENYVVDREQCWAGIPPFRAPLGRVKWDLQTQNWVGKCEGEWVVASRARGCLFDAIAVVTLLLLPMAGAVFCYLKRRKRKRLEREAMYKREQKQKKKKEEIEYYQRAAREREQRKQQVEEEEQKLGSMTPAAREEWWRNRKEEQEKQRKSFKSAQKNWTNVKSIAVWRNSKAGKRKVPDKILYNWQGEVGTRRGEGSLASAKILYGDAWNRMEPEEKKLILYRLDTEYSRPTSTEAWQKPMNKPALPESPRKSATRSRGDSQQHEGPRTGGGRRGRSAKVAPAGAQDGKRHQGAASRRLPALRNRGSTEPSVEVGDRAAGFFAAGGEHPNAWAIEDIGSSP